MKQTVSAIITTYNRADIVPDAIASVLAQTYPISELIVIDDGSSDHTSDTVEHAFQGSSIPTRYIFKPNGGMVTSLNRGIEEAKSDWVAFLDDDDLWAPDHIEKSIHILDKTNESDCIISLREEKGKTQIPPEKLLKPYQPHPVLEHVLIHKQATLTRPFFTSTVGTCVIKRDLAKKLKFDNEVGARLDIHFFWRVSEHTDIALDLEAHGVGRQFRTSYLSTDDSAPKELQEKIILRRNQDEIKMLSKLTKDRDITDAAVFYTMLNNAILGRVYLNRKIGNFNEARQHIRSCIGKVPMTTIAKEAILCSIKSKR